MKKLLMDLGNTSLKWMLTNSGKKIEEGQFNHNDNFSNQILDKLPKDFDVAYLASVVNTELKDTLVSIIKNKHSLVVKEILSEAYCCGISNAYNQPKNLGVDRWLACIAVKKAYPKDTVCILDLGTAITLDIVDKKGQHKGGHILPGLNATKSLLLKDTSLSLTGDVKITSGLAKDTAVAINSSYAMAVVALVEKQIKKEQVDKLVLTGSDSGQISDFIKITAEIKSSLVLQGLQIVSEID